VSNLLIKIPEEVITVARSLSRVGFSVYLVGGWLRDALLRRESASAPDLATNALPEEIQKIFPDSVYENEFGTVLVKSGSENEDLKIIEITTFRTEKNYFDKRHPDSVQFVKNIEEDLARRDITINALAFNLDEKVVGNILDLFDGQKDIENKIIRAVGDPQKRFEEDALRLMRAVRFACQLGFAIEEKTLAAIKKNAPLLKEIAEERIRDEFSKIMMTKRAKVGIELLEETGLLKFIMPELREGIGVAQNLHHIYSVWEHNLLALDYAAKKDFSLELRLASLLHDVGKPRTKSGEGKYATFYAHEIVGARMAKKILENLKFSKETVEKVVHLVRYHLFYYNVGEVTEAGVRRFIARVGIEQIDDLLKIRQADRIGSGVPKAVPYKLRHLLFMIDKVRQDPISPKMLKINGLQVMEILKIQPGPRVGWILGVLLEEVLDEPHKNIEDYLGKRVKEFGELSDGELLKMSEKSRQTKQEFEQEVEEETKKKYYV